MPLGVLNNISAIYAENNLNQTQASLQNVLTQLSSGSRINSGADDPAGLSIANGLAANSAALTQSSSNASEGVGFLQVADGALSQVTSLLTSAVTLATEAGGGTLSSSQMSAANQEYQDILSQIGTIGATTEYNGIQVFSADTNLNALSWAQGTSAAADTATATGASTLAASAITAGGTTADATNAASGGTYNTTPADETAMVWTAQSTSGTANNVLTSAPIGANQELTGTLTFEPTGAASAVTVNLGTTLTAGTSLTAQATQLGTALGADYAVSVVNGDQLQIGISAAGGTAGLTAMVAPTVSGSLATQNAYTLTVADGDSLSGTLVLTPQSTTAAGTPADVSFSGTGTSAVTATVTPGDTLAGSLTIGANITAGTATALAWANNGMSSTTTITPGDTLTGGFTVTPTTTGSQTATDVSIAGLTSANLQSTLQTALGASNYTVAYNTTTGALSITAVGTGITAIAVANDASAAKEATPASTPSTTVSLAGVATSNLEDTLQSALGSAFAVTYNTTSGALSIGLGASAGTGSTISYTATATPVTEGTAAAVSDNLSSNANPPVSITLAGTNTANLVQTVQSALGSNYTVSYSALSGVGTLSVSALNASITGIVGSGTITQTAADTASIAVNDGNTLGGELTINQTVGGTAASPVTVNLTGASVDGVLGGGTSTTGSGQALIDAVNTALGSNAQYYTVGYNVDSGTGVGTLSIAINSVGEANNASSVSIANGTSTNALYQTQTTNSAITVGSSVLGDFTLTPTGSTGTPISVDLATTSTADLAATLQAALGTDYLVGYNTPAVNPADAPATPSTAGTLSIGISQAGIAAGITGFTVTEATTQAASMVSAPKGGVDIYTSDGTATGSDNYNVTVGALSDASVGTSSASSALGTQLTVTVGGVTGTGGTVAGGTAGTSLAETTLTSQADAEAALQTVDDAINAVAYQRGQVGANINTLNAASNISSSQQTNITSAENTITATDYAAATSDMSKYEILTQTGISALAQANSTQQMVTKLLQ